MIYDTPGFDESAEADEKYCTELILKLKSIEYYNNIFK
jgi:hypothetical protein